MPTLSDKKEEGSSGGDLFKAAGGLGLASSHMAEQQQPRLPPAPPPPRLIARQSSNIYSGSRFKGEQKSGRNAYEVTVDLQVRWFPWRLGLSPPTNSQSPTLPHRTY